MSAEQLIESRYGGKGRLSLSLPRFGRGFPRVFVFRQAKVSHRAVIAREGDAVAFEFGIFELAPQVQLVLDTRLAFLLGAKSGRRQPAVGGHGLGSCPEGPQQKNAYRP